MKSKKMGIVSGFVALLIVSSGGVSIYKLGVGIGQNQAVVNSVSDKLSDAFLSETIIRCLETNHALEAQDRERVKAAVMIQLADTAYFYSQKLGQRPARMVPRPVCEALPKLEALAGATSDSYVHTSLQKSLLVLTQHCDQKQSATDSGHI